ncbi:DEAD/DEAH box helicase [Nonomuraea cavernae]|uniref:Helicase SNF2 n=1 Tax=Nonomuraea cavernae TaxID=2045107 RepID=A0A917YT83_9ACTN|nr:DEAD/DEAH box helicase [Nonomuraea cavernae]MCA2184296.1 DEAD/DEAH box helicase [Nonomuraea cavernae]GGO64234.1 helicase SNF2 [Nonomuraea cavernae]
MRSLLRRAGRLLDDTRRLGHEHDRALAEVRAALDAVRDRLSRAGLGAIPLARLKDVTGGRLRLGSLESAGYTTVLSVLEATPYELQRVPGIGPQTQRQAHAAARQIALAARGSTAVQIDVEHQDPETTALLVTLHRLVAAGPDLPRARRAAETVGRRLGTLLPAARPAASWWRTLLSGAERRDHAARAVAELGDVLARETETRLLLAQATADLLRPPPDDDEAWIDFEIRSADYYNLLAELAALEPDDRVAAEGFLPDELAERVRSQRLDDTHRRVSLRGYQAFGARFALAQRRVILGDEMGLGKTVQAIAAMAHLRAEGATHFLVVCPASVLVNWIREIETRSTLRVYRLHGAERATAQAEWPEHGGVAVTTFDGLAKVEAAHEVAMLVVDEAHYAKNPEARRSREVARWCGRVDRVLFMTGTPMENRVEEFRNLVRHVQPGLLAEVRSSDAAAGAGAFRRAVAPVYLRRNQEDVLTELPDLVHVDEWEELSAADADVYREAVAAGRFMAMRRAAYAVPEKSAKLERLRELVEEAAQSELKVVVFSYFRDVLATVGEELGDHHGPISGDLAPERRQQVVDAFTAAPGHAVLLAQIQAGGVGLNLQAASVVIICEPQVKPTMESQAVARAHRMGQVRRVQVHRLLSPDSVDERMLRLLHAKSALFDAFARRSDLAESTPDAIDVSEQTLARQIVEEEQRRLHVGDAAAPA